ncbi:phosphonate ABC transporter, permease protein PhnE [Thermomonospora umbrina]|uniref:Phosphonate transport system permease protein n=1 Tax=Thermomonospora umbrina TaxID=111806 RepID=A0A3D9SWG7_9ACTN|nr:phosphonate ABC transporter, permease protein PhnE [Thermomonospora umbrina]REE99937.1 phosphonate transport system permease protein [Thermomonospora umbrina]
MAGSSPPHPALRRAPRAPLIAAGGVFIAATVAVCLDLGVSGPQLASTVPAFLGFIADTMWPPDFSGLPDLLRATLLTIEVAFLGTLGATLVSLPLALLAARNLAPHPTVFAAVRFVITLCRAIPDFVFALMFVAALGLGPLPGVLGLALHSIGMLGKVYAERIEEIDPGPPEALAAVGAHHLQVVRLAVLPQVAPSLVANTLYRFDINIRSSIVLGIVGAGGVGFELVTALQALDYRRAAAVMVVVLGLVAVVETISNRIRRRYL